MSGLFGSSKVSQPQATAALTLQQSSYGTPIQLVYGTNRIYGNLIWYGFFNSQLVSTGGGGGKGGVVGGGGKGGGNSEYNYWASFAIGLCEGTIAGINNVYISKQISSVPDLGGTVFNGAQGQATWGYLTTYAPSVALQYSELAYVGFPNFSLGTSSETPQFSFEAVGKFIFSGTQDCSPDQFFIDFLTRSGMPTAYIDTFAAAATYWQAAGFLLSPVIDQQRTALDWLKEVMALLNSEFVWLPSQGVISAVPYGDTACSGNGVTYTPNFTAIYSLNDNDFIRDGDVDPITCTRASLSDVYNQMPIEYINRGDQYNVETYTAFDDGLTDVYGFRVAPTLSAHHITDPNVAQTVATLVLNRGIYVRNTYEFKLPWQYCLLDPLDIIEITDVNMGTVNLLVRIVSIEEDEKDGCLTFTVEEIPNAIGGAVLYPTFGTARYVANYNIDAPEVNLPIIFEAPLAYLQANMVEVDVAISGNGANWGGCNIWVSTDGITYQYLEQFNNESRMGSLTANLANFTGSGIDTTDTLSISMAISEGVLNNSATTADAVNLNTLCYVDGELICYGQDVLTGTNTYNLSYLNRGCYGSPISAHASGSKFARFDAGIFRYDVDQTYVGKTLYFKFLSYNQWGSGIQDLSEASAYSYTVLGTALLTPPANPANVTTNYFGDIAQVNWSSINDIRTPIYYELRRGASFATATLVGRTTQPNFRVSGAGTYWVAALFITPLGVNVYSSSPPSIVVAVPYISQNILGAYQEETGPWTGTKTNCSVSGSNLVTTLGATTASYLVPSGHIIASNYQCSARVNINWQVSSVSSSSDITAITDITAIPDMTFAGQQGYVSAVPQVNLYNGGAWGGWQNWVPGVYTFEQINFQMLFTVADTSYQAELSQFDIEVDVDDLVQTGTVTTSSTALVNVIFPLVFNVIPAVTLTIQNASAGDDAIITSISTSGFTLEVLNTTLKVVRTVTYNAVGN